MRPAVCIRHQLISRSSLRQVARDGAGALALGPQHPSPVAVGPQEPPEDSPGQLERQDCHSLHQLGRTVPPELPDAQGPAGKEGHREGHQEPRRASQGLLDRDGGLSKPGLW
jgi:hypothetical protein